jgi:hypothetical protein
MVLVNTLFLVMIISVSGCSKKSPLSPQKSSSSVKRSSIYFAGLNLPPGAPIEYSLFLESMEKVHICFKERDPADSFVYMLIVDSDTTEGKFCNAFSSETAIALPQGKSLYSMPIHNDEPPTELKVFLRRTNEGNGTIGLLEK